MQFVIFFSILLVIFLSISRAVRMIESVEENVRQFGVRGRSLFRVVVIFFILVQFFGLYCFLYSGEFECIFLGFGRENLLFFFLSFIKFFFFGSQQVVWNIVVLNLRLGLGLIDRQFDRQGGRQEDREGETDGKTQILCDLRVQLFQGRKKEVEVLF